MSASKHFQHKGRRLPGKISWWIVSRARFNTQGNRRWRGEDWSRYRWALPTYGTTGNCHLPGKISRWTRARFHTQGNAGQPSDTWLPGRMNALLILAGDDFVRHTKVQLNCKINMEVSKFLLLRISLRMHAIVWVNSVHSANGHTGSGDPII